MRDAQQEKFITFGWFYQSQRRGNIKYEIVSWKLRKVSGIVAKQSRKDTIKQSWEGEDHLHTKTTTIEIKEIEYNKDRKFAKREWTASDKDEKH